MSTGTTSGRNRLLVPAVAGAILLAIIIGIVIVSSSGGEDTPAAPKPTKTTKTTPAPKAPQAKVKGSGLAPQVIAVKTATFARGANVFAVGAEIPDIDIKKIDTVTLVLDNGDVWRLKTLQDPRGGFVIPQLYLVKGLTEEQYACTAGMRIKGPQLTMTIPLKCLDDPKKPLRAHLEITDNAGGAEKTTTSKRLDAPKV